VYFQKSLSKKNPLVKNFDVRKNILNTLDLRSFEEKKFQMYSSLETRRRYKSGKWNKSIKKPKNQIRNFQ
jgi:hypothetical protein